ncbi:CarD family transcriptional regulator [Bacillus sinesaloumensis]|uniref:CarD family transcriptional regulator n=1 Tax=Litchfieldia sinesaloumensis TaxID=1926280 RepID=UPI00098849F2|nr:CarD family transcriptional regulator [Bacillus sinesaloumensis]
MFNIGDLVIYSTMGICRINDICEKTYAGTTREYYVMHPIEDDTLTIQNPVDNKKVMMKKIIGQSEAEEVLESFKLPGIQWIDNGNERNRAYSGIVSSGDRKGISSIINTLLCKKYKLELADKKISEQDRKLLLYIQKVLFKELAITLDTTVEAIAKQVDRMISYRMTKSSPLEIAKYIN